MDADFSNGQSFSGLSLGECSIADFSGYDSGSVCYTVYCCSNPSEAFTSCADFIIGCGNNPVETPGCTYDVATNYNPEATIDDGSCEFDCNNDCTGDVNNDSAVSVADILILLTQFGAVCN